MIQQLSHEGKHDKLRGIHLLITLTTIDASPVGFSRLVERCCRHRSVVVAALWHTRSAAVESTIEP